MADKTQQVQIKIKAETTRATNQIKKLNREIDNLNKLQVKIEDGQSI